MDLFVLSGDRPIIKKYSRTPRKKLKKTSYPFIQRFTSFSYQVDTIQDFYTVICEHAKAGNCLVKGLLQRDLDNESRAGSTSPESLTEWICLDFDGVNCFESIDTALEAIGCGNTDYILQWSASYGVESEKTELHCHVFMLLDEPAHPSVLKRYLRHVNLTTALQSELRLAKSHNAMCWPLDITTCQNDKLLYISPPRFEDGLRDPMGDKGRIELVEREFRKLELPLSATPDDALVRAAELKHLNRLRKEAGLKARPNPKYDVDTDIQYLVSPDAAQVTGIKTERGFVYFNLNGGDSWGYYHPIDNPAFIHNFKGEPTYRTEDLLPAYWDEIKARVTNLEPDAGGKVYLAFRDFDSATYWNGIYDAGEKRIIRLAEARGESQLRHFMKQHGQPLGDFIPDWDMEFNPHRQYVIDQARKKLNTYRPSQYFARKPVSRQDVPETIQHILFHVVGSDEGVYEHFLNWLAVIVQGLCMTQTAWVLHGTQGTGKGVLFNHILTPLFGVENVTSRRMEELGSDFTEFMKNKFIVFIDEVSSGNTLYHERITAKLKNLIVEPRVSVREMYRPSTVMANYTNLIFASNDSHPISLAPDDRRFNVAVFQPERISLSPSDIERLPEEIGDFYDHLGTRSADPELARTPIATADRLRLINTSRPSIDVAVEALKTGRLAFFVDLLVEKTEVLSPAVHLIYEQYRALLEELQDSRRTKLTRDELIVIMRWAVDSKMPTSPNKFAMMLRHHGLEMKPLWNGEKTVRGFDVEEWK